MATPRRLAGFLFEDRTPSTADVLPRMDIAVFVGFATSGPLHLPVPIESPDRFRDLFGGDLPLAWDAHSRRMQTAHLAATVRAFFANGGERCWIIRVADETRAETSRFAVPSLVRCSASGNLSPALALARSPGRGTDDLRLTTALLSTPVVIASLQGLEAGWLALPQVSAHSVNRGDLLRLRFPDTGWLAFFPVDRFEERTFDSPTQTVPVAVAKLVSWWREARFFAASASSGVASFLDPTSSPVTAVATWSYPQPTESTAIDLPSDLDLSPALGSFLQVDFPGQTLWLLVSDVYAAESEGSPPRRVLRVLGEAWWTGMSTPMVSSAGAASVECLSFELDTAEVDADARRLSGLGFVSGHPLFWNDLPSDASLYASTDDSSSEPPALWSAATEPRFPLAGTVLEAGDFFLPLGMHTLSSEPAFAEHSKLTALERDGLSVFSAELFLDEALLDQGVSALIGYADSLRFLSRVAHRLRGLHAALPIEEATLIAVPDAAHLGWQQNDPKPPPPPTPSAPYSPVGDSTFDDCARLHLLAPVLRVSEDSDPTSAYTLSWEGPPDADTFFFVQEAAFPDFSGAVLLLKSTARQTTILGRPPGNYYYRVRAQRGCTSSDWSNGVVEPVRADQSWLVNDPPSDGTSAPELLAVHRALVRLSAARADLLALLSLPGFARSQGALTLAAQLTSPVSPAILVGTTLVRPLGYGEASAWSYAALYHPWVELSTPEGDILPIPPDGAIAGMIAKRALLRGAWIAPANEPLIEPLALTPAIERERRLDLLTSQINLVRAEPRGFLALSADTLSQEESLRPINVRRLLILLRRLALRLGQTYVFEANSPAFRRLVQHTFESALLGLHQRGAFAGSTASESFRVNTGDDANPPASVEVGRLIVEIKVAPALPLSFITVRLVQSGDRTSVSEFL